MTYANLEEIQGVLAHLKDVVASPEADKDQISQTIQECLDRVQTLTRNKESASSESPDSKNFDDLDDVFMSSSQDNICLKELLIGGVQPANSCISSSSSTNAGSDHPLRLLSTSALKKDTIAKTDEFDRLISPLPVIQAIEHDYETTSSSSGKGSLTKRIYDPVPSGIYESIDPSSPFVSQKDQVRPSASFHACSQTSDPYAHVYSKVDKNNQRAVSYVTFSSEDYPQVNPMSGSKADIDYPPIPGHHRHSDVTTAGCGKKERRSEMDPYYEFLKTDCPPETSSKKVSRTKSMKDRPDKPQEKSSLLTRRGMGRFSLKMKEPPTEQGSIAKNCPVRLTGGVYEIPFDELDTPASPVSPVPEERTAGGFLRSGWNKLKRTVSIKNRRR